MENLKNELSHEDMDDPGCLYRTEDGICTGNLETCCVYQSTEKRMAGGRRLRSLKECYCNYPNVSVTPEVERAILDLAKLANLMHRSEKCEKFESGEVPK